MKKIILVVLYILTNVVSLSDSDFDKAFDMIIRNEGIRYVDNREIDEISKFGITLKTLQGVGYDVNYDGWINKSDVKSLTLSKSKRFYMRYYHAPIKELKYIDGKYSTYIYNQILDIGINMGTTTSIIMLQTAINDYIAIQRKNGNMDFKYIKVDGIIGAETVGILERCKLSDINNGLVEIRKRKYTEIYRKAPSVYKRHYNGWINRANKYLIVK